jgi:hypothetical protein
MDPSHDHDEHCNRKAETYMEVSNALGWGVAELLKHNQ